MPEASVHDIFKNGWATKGSGKAHWLYTRSNYSWSATIVETLCGRSVANQRETLEERGWTRRTENPAVADTCERCLNSRYQSSATVPNTDATPDRFLVPRLYYHTSDGPAIAAERAQKNQEAIAQAERNQEESINRAFDDAGLTYLGAEERRQMRALMREAGVNLNVYGTFAVERLVALRGIAAILGRRVEVGA